MVVKKSSAVEARQWLADLHALRARFPHWGFVCDPSRNDWYALRGKNGFVRAVNATQLGLLVETRERSL